MSDPYEEYIRNVIASKALYPDNLLPEVPAHIKMYLNLPPQTLEDSKETFDRLSQLFPLHLTDRSKESNLDASKRR